MAYKVLHQKDVLQILEGRESAIPRIAEEDEKNRTKITEELCPQCGEGLTPVVPRDPERVFSGTRINYDKVCPVHGVI